MHSLRKKRLSIITVALGVAICAVFLILYALRQNISLFYAPSDLVKQRISSEQLIRLGGLVVPGSVQHDKDSLRVIFKITDNAREVKVEYNGVLPDLFREGQSIVTQGHLLTDGSFKAVDVLAKHDEKYVPKEVQDSLHQQGSLTTG